MYFDPEVVAMLIGFGVFFGTCCVAVWWNIRKAERQEREAEAAEARYADQRAFHRLDT